MTQAEIVNAWISGLGAVGTFLAVGVALLLAIYGDRLKAWRTGPKLRLRIDGPKGNPIPGSDSNVRVYYCLNVVNRRPSAIATNCQVVVKKMWRRLPDGQYGDVQLPYPLVLSWPPSEFTPMATTIRHENLVDFGYVQEGLGFVLNVRIVPNGFDRFVRAGETMQYGLEIVSDNFVSQELQVFEVTWNGGGTKELDEMAKNLKIREVNT